MIDFNKIPWRVEYFDNDNHNKIKRGFKSFNEAKLWCDNNGLDIQEYLILKDVENYV